MGDVWLKLKGDHVAVEAAEDEPAEGLLLGHGWTSIETNQGTDLGDVRIELKGFRKQLNLLRMTPRGVSCQAAEGLA